MDPRIVKISETVETAAQASSDSADLISRTRVLWPDATNAEIRRAALYALTAPVARQDGITLRLHSLAIEAR